MLSISRKYGGDYRYPRLKVALIIWGKRILVDCSTALLMTAPLSLSLRGSGSLLEAQNLQRK